MIRKSSVCIEVYVLNENKITVRRWKGIKKMDVKFSFDVTRFSGIRESIISQQYTGISPYPAGQAALNLIFRREKLLFTRTFTVKRVFMTYTEIVFSFNLTKAVPKTARYLVYVLSHIFGIVSSFLAMEICPWHIPNLPPLPKDLSANRLRVFFCNIEIRT